MIRRRTTLYPVIPSIVTIALAIALLAAGTIPESGKDNFWLSLNVSRVGQEIIQVNPVSNTGGTDRPPGSVGGFFDKIFGPIVSNITAAIGDGVEDLQGQIAENLIKSLGLKDVYNLFLSKACEGNFENPDDPNSAVAIERCVDYEDRQQGLRNITNSIPSYFIIGPANVSVPLINTISSTLDSALSLATAAAHAMLVLLIIGTASVGISLLGTIVIVIQGFRCPVVWINMCFANLGTTSLFIFAGTATGAIVAGSSAVNGLGEAFSIGTTQGTSFLAMGWIAAVFSLFGSIFWFSVWFVEFRRSAFRRVRRSEEEIGNWRGILSEVRRNLRVRDEKEQGEKARSSKDSKAVESGGGLTYG